MVKNKTNDKINDKNIYQNDLGAGYFKVGDTYIKINEHFAKEGKSITELISDIIHHAILCDI